MVLAHRREGFSLAHDRGLWGTRVSVLGKRVDNRLSCLAGFRSVRCARVAALAGNDGSLTGGSVPRNDGSFAGGSVCAASGRSRLCVCHGS